MSQLDAHYGGNLVDGARILALFGDAATELCIRHDGDEGLLRAYESVEVLAPTHAGDFLEGEAEIVKVGEHLPEDALRGAEVRAAAAGPLGQRGRRARRARGGVPRGGDVRRPEGQAARRALRGDVILLDPANVLESGIEIVAQPRGKKVQSITSLWGGEKALTAIALMFAIFRYKPSPFCLLDEIDAPLDDANIGRFLKMLNGMLDHTQFIIITHSSKTMEMADRLYGVTMEEPGVSKLISLKLN